MKVALFGATGLLGQDVIKQLLAHGHEVKALVRNPKKLAVDSSDIEVIQGDYFNPLDQEKALQYVDAVVSTIGPPTVTKGSPQPHQYQAAMDSLITLMEQKGVSRIVNVAGASATYQGENIQLSRHLIRWLMKMTVPVITPAKELEIERLRLSNLDYTIVRPPVIADSAKGQFTASNEKMKGTKVERQQLAHFMVDVIDKSDWYGTLPFVANTP
ncbi:MULTISPECIES: NAD(P)-dependent oxidoreductase [Vibrio]|uniref:NAD(P)-dependent oxidoreductase n=1 Tax=Vibrio TaxID=662 RepID=UPI00142EF293|nr:MULTISPECIES: NAD(P)H-binding protein [Vibrio]